MALTDKQERFVEEYLVDLNATKAAIRAGYSEDAARFIGHENLTKPYIQDAIAKAKQLRSDRLKITQDKVLNELARVAFGDMRRLAKWDKDTLTLKTSDELQDDDAAIIAEVTMKPSQYGNSLKIKSYDKLKALEMIGRHIGLFDKADSDQQEAPPVEPRFIVNPPKDEVITTNANSE